MALSKLRAQRIIKHGSGYYQKDLPELIAGAWVIYSLADLGAEAPKYSPLDFLEITNTDTASRVRVILDHGDGLVVPASSIRRIEDMPFRNVQVRNEGAATIAAGKVSLLAQRRPITVDKYIREFRL